MEWTYETKISAEEWPKPTEKKLSFLHPSAPLVSNPISNHRRSQAARAISTTRGLDWCAISLAQNIMETSSIQQSTIPYRRGQQAAPPQVNHKGGQNREWEDYTRAQYAISPSKAPWTSINPTFNHDRRGQDTPTSFQPCGWGRKLNHWDNCGLIVRYFPAQNSWKFNQSNPTSNHDGRGQAPPTIQLNHWERSLG